MKYLKFLILRRATSPYKFGPYDEYPTACSLLYVVILYTDACLFAQALCFIIAMLALTNSLSRTVVVSFASMLLHLILSGATFLAPDKPICTDAPKTMAISSLSELIQSIPACDHVFHEFWSSVSDKLRSGLQRIDLGNGDAAAKCIGSISNMKRAEEECGFRLGMNQFTKESITSS